MLLTFHINFEQFVAAFVSTHLPTCFTAYVSAHLLVCIYSLISNRRTKHNSDTKHITTQDQTYCFNYLITQNFKLKYLRTKFYCFFIAFWSLLPKVMLVLQWGWCQFVPQYMNSHSVSHFIFSIINFVFISSWK